MLPATYLLALCVLGLIWRRWCTRINGVSLNSTSKRVLFTSYWLLAVSLLVSMLVSLSISVEDVSPSSFRKLAVVSAGFIAQVALAATVMAPITMREYKHWSFLHAVIVNECIVLPGLLLGGIFFWMAVWPDRATEWLSKFVK